MKENYGHTATPWTKADDGMGIFGIYGPNSESIATVGGLPQNNREAGEQAADARLIAAAPELLTALQGVVAATEANPDLRGKDGWNYEERLELRITEARAAIAKAEGRA